MKCVDVSGDWILLVEGVDDEHVLKHICGNRGGPQLSEVKTHDGVEDLLDSIPTTLRFAEENDVIGIVIDADIGLDSRWQALRARFAEAGYQDVPSEPNPSGTVIEPPDGGLLPRAGVWIMPDNRTTGKLEDFLRFLVPQPSELFDHATASVDGIPYRLFSQPDELKAVLHTWLAWQREPGKPYGTAITARFLDPDVPIVDVLVSWLERLFISPRASG